MHILSQAGLRTSGISQAWCPNDVWCCVSVGPFAQLRRALLINIQALCDVFRPARPKSLKRRHTPWSLWHLPSQWRQLERETPETPMPQLPLVRVLETIDLSTSNVEHFLDKEAAVTGYKQHKDVRV